MAKVISFEDALKSAGEKPRSLLLANGFSIAYFHYGTLLDNAGLQNTDPLRRLFDQIKTKDFERVLRILKDAASVSQAYEWKEQAATLAADITKLREALVTAIRKTHPAHRDVIGDIILPCVAFLEKFERIFTLNYDLLLNWVTLENGTFSDGFGLGKKSNGFIAPFKTDAKCSVFNLHGGLHLFRGSGDTLEKRLDEGKGVIDAISSTITKGERLPLYVAEGTSEAKLFRIRNNSYLQHCYEHFEANTNTLFVYGHSADDNDAHILNAIFKSGVEKVYFSVYPPSNDTQAIDGQLAKYKARNGSKVEYTLFDARTASVWGAA